MATSSYSPSYRLPGLFMCAALVLFLVPAMHYAAPTAGKKSEGTPSATQKNPPGKAGTAEVNKAWMQAIHGKSSAAGQKSAATKSKPDATAGAAKPKPVKPPSRPRPRTAGQSVFQNTEGPSFVSLVVRFAGICAIMLAGFYFLMRYIKRKNGGIGAGGGDLIKVISSVPLVQGKFIQIVDMAGKLMVLGVSDSSVSILTVVEDARTADRIRLWQSERAANPVLPDNMLERLTQMFKGADYRFWVRPRSESSAADQSPDFREFMKSYGADANAAPRTNPPNVGSEALQAGPGNLTAQAAPNMGVDAARDENGTDHAPVSSGIAAAPSGIAAAAVAEDPDRELKELLRRQRNRLAALKSQNQPG